MLLRRSRQVVVRADAAFCNQKIFDVGDADGQFFAVVPAAQNPVRIAASHRTAPTILHARARLQS